ncbi:hypothetical protein QW131_10125 [Roseibium salinum]|nr:hypothetical protein [Roseibium salinum]
MALAVVQHKRQQGATGLVHGPGCPEPSVRPHSPIQIGDAKRIAPPAAHRAERFLTETADLVTALGTLKTDLETCLAIRPPRQDGDSPPR